MFEAGDATYPQVGCEDGRQIVLKTAGLSKTKAVVKVAKYFSSTQQYLFEGFTHSVQDAKQLDACRYLVGVRLHHI